MYALNSGVEDGKDEVSITFDGRVGHYSVSASCHAPDWHSLDDDCYWNDGEKIWNVYVCAVQADMLGDDEVESPFPLLFLNDDCDDDALVEEKLKARRLFWKDGSVKPDLEGAAPAAYADDDLKPVRIEVANVFGGDTELLRRLWIRVEAADGIRLHGDSMKNAPDPARWIQDGDGGWRFRVMDGRGQAQFACRLHAEGVGKGRGRITATLLVAQDDAMPNAMTACTPVVSDGMEVPVLDVALVPDYDRDGVAGSGGERRDALLGRPLRMWYNDNTDIDGFNLWDFEDMDANASFWKTGSDFLGSVFGGVFDDTYRHPETDKWAPNCTDGIVNGRGDLLDLFPVWLDAKEFLELKADGMELRVELAHARGELKAVFSDLAPDDVKSFRHTDGPRGHSDLADHDLGEAPVHSLGGPLSRKIQDRWLGGGGVLLCEGTPTARADGDSCLVATFRLVGEGAPESERGYLLGRRRLNTSVSHVSAMYRYYSLRGCETDPQMPARRVGAAEGAPSRTMDLSEPPNMPDSETDPVFFAFVHGFNVDERESGNWQGRLFKRLYQTGANVRFVGIDWNGDEGPSWNYHTNAEYAFRTAGALKRCLSELASGGGRLFLLAHSLGNMLVSSAIADHGLKADGFFMLNAAVAAEAYDPTRHNTSGENNPMVPPEWRDYPYETWSAGWHSLFDKTDDRSRLAWKGRFEAMLQAPGTSDGSKLAVYNYYDSEDEVIRTETDGELALTSGWD